MIKLKPGAEILEQIPYIFLVPKRSSLSIADLQLFLQECVGISSIGIQSPSQFEVEEYTSVIALKQSATDKNFCAIKVLFKSYLDEDMEQKLRLLYSLKNKYQCELFDGRSLEHLNFSKAELKGHLVEIQQLKKEELLHDILPVFSLN
jgi:hypothetical protein